METFEEQIKSAVGLNIADELVAKRFLERLKEGRYTRDEYPRSHYCVYFLPYNPGTRQVFIVHHKKSGLWLSPGGHIDRGETLIHALNREIQEELGIRDKVKEGTWPFLLTITPIDNSVQPCKEHLDIWYRFPTDGSDLTVDPREFHATQWVTIDDAKKIITDGPNLTALSKIEKFFY